VQSLSKQLGVRRPTVYRIETATPIVLAAGLLPTQSSLFVSEELMKRLTPDEVRAVLAFELIQLKERQSSIATAASAVAGIFALSAMFIDRIVFLGFFYLRPARPGLALVLVSPLIALIVRMSVSRKGILRADREAAALIGNERILARALWKLDAYVHARPLDVSPADAHLFVVNPGRSFARSRLFQAHPTVKQRITHLVGHYPI
jgi:heat shock protein HtpX